MRHVTSILYALLCMAYIAFSFTMLPYWNTNVAILGIALVALAGWLYGTTTGLLFVIPHIIYHGVLFSVVYAHLTSPAAAKASGIVITVSVVILLGNLRRNFDALKKTNELLDRTVDERNAELRGIAIKLIENSEYIRVVQGQQLHDGIGQQLAGIQLFCASIAEQLLSEQNPSVSLAFSLRERASKTHNMMRKAARMLFPVKIGETGLASAIDELASSFREMKQIPFDVSGNGDYCDLSEETALHIYRICQESAIFAVDALKADKIEVQMDHSNTAYRFCFTHNGTRWMHQEDSLEQRLIAYRLEKINGSMHIHSREESERVIYNIPKPWPI